MKLPFAKIVSEKYGRLVDMGGDALFRTIRYVFVHPEKGEYDIEVSLTDTIRDRELGRLREEWEDAKFEYFLEETVDQEWCRLLAEMKAKELFEAKFPDPKGFLEKGFVYLKGSDGKRYKLLHQLHWSVYCLDTDEFLCALPRDVPSYDVWVAQALYIQNDVKSFREAANVDSTLARIESKIDPYWESNHKTWSEELTEEFADILARGRERRQEREENHE